LLEKDIALFHITDFGAASSYRQQSYAQSSRFSHRSLLHVSPGNPVPRAQSHLREPKVGRGALLLMIVLNLFPF
jgi:hypothetical protein